MSKQEMIDFEYEFLTGNWKGVKGAAYNATYEFCLALRWCDETGKITDWGEKAVEAYEEEIKQALTGPHGRPKRL